MCDLPIPPTKSARPHWTRTWSSRKCAWSESINTLFAIVMLRLLCWCEAIYCTIEHGTISLTPVTSQSVELETSEGDIAWVSIDVVLHLAMKVVKVSLKVVDFSVHLNYFRLTLFNAGKFIEIWTYLITSAQGLMFSSSELMAEAMKGESGAEGGANSVFRTHDKSCNCPHSMRAQRLLTVRRMLVSIYFQSMSSDKGTVMLTIISYLHVWIL